MIHTPMKAHVNFHDASLPGQFAGLLKETSFKAYAMSYFDGMDQDHLALLSQTQSSCGGTLKDALIIMLSNRDAESGQPRSSSELLTPQERAYLLSDKGVQHIVPFFIGCEHSQKDLFASFFEKVCMAGTVNKLIPGADVWAMNAFRDALTGQPLPDTRFRDVEWSAREKLIALTRTGAMKAFSRHAGYFYPLTGKVVEGNRIGRKLGYPTANLYTANTSKILPAQGVYVVMALHDGQWHQGMANIGIRPTLDLEHVTVEAHLFDFNADLYGETISLAFLDRIRDEMRFGSLAELKVQLDRDAVTARAVLSSILPGITPGCLPLIRC